MGQFRGPPPPPSVPPPCGCGCGLWLLVWLHFGYTDRGPEGSFLSLWGSLREPLWNHFGLPCKGWIGPGAAVFARSCLALPHRHLPLCVPLPPQQKRTFSIIAGAVLMVQFTVSGSPGTIHYRELLVVLARPKPCRGNYESTVTDSSPFAAVTLDERLNA